MKFRYIRELKRYFVNFTYWISIKTLLPTMHNLILDTCNELHLINLPKEYCPPNSKSVSTLMADRVSTCKPTWVDPVYFTVNITGGRFRTCARGTENSIVGGTRNFSISFCKVNLMSFEVWKVVFSFIVVFDSSYGNGNWLLK